MSKKNVVAKVLKIYAVVNAALGLFSGIYWISQSSNLFGDFGIIFIGLCLVFSFGIYAFGEVVQLLQDIKDTTQKIKAAVGRNVEESDFKDLPII